MGTKNYNNALDLVSFSRASGGTALRKISYGTELVTNGTFDTDTTGWTAVRSSTLSSPSNNLRVTNAGGVTAGAAEQVVSTEVGKVYQISADFTYGGATSGAIRIPFGLPLVSYSIRGMSSGWLNKVRVPSG